MLTAVQAQERNEGNSEIAGIATADHVVGAQNPTNQMECRQRD
jgi:hypothetical protein